ncbi:hypothetical protein V1286_000249 [Bradyrhizobium algeriense]|uniref:Uncharacterized protein n=1 Tax=Bradyrhizobium algeriense TaxID=634784 RepID=A0ABU8B2F5_9BRAD
MIFILVLRASRLVVPASRRQFRQQSASESTTTAMMTA